MADSPPRVSLRADSLSPVVLEHEQSDMQNTMKSDKLSRRTTFAPGVIDSMNASPLQQSVRQSSVIKQPSVIKHSSIVKQPSIVRQTSSVKQPSIVNQSSLPRQSSVVRQTSNVRLRSTTPSKGQPFARLQLPDDRSPLKSLTSKQSMDSQIPRKRSSSSLQTARTVKIEDVLDDYKSAVERKAKPEAQTGQHAQELDAAMQKLTLNWIINTFVRHSAFALFAWSCSDTCHGLLSVYAYMMHIFVLHISLLHAVLKPYLLLWYVVPFHGLVW